jgi:hypothetical protein
MWDQMCDQMWNQRCDQRWDLAFALFVASHVFIIIYLSFFDQRFDLVIVLLLL